jgi:hypothetical protein
VVLLQAIEGNQLPYDAKAGDAAAAEYYDDENDLGERAVVQQEIQQG